ncbi:hypothetical protein Bbelb_139320 [Branchiostoma belcheri]|nr:hypothetical protein Bbelb_139320 [Branchiostoma belcheri]
MTSSPIPTIPDNRRTTPSLLPKMADGLGDFEDQPAQQQQEEDPAAAFLAREQDELAGLEDDDVAGLQEETPAAQGKGIARSGTRSKTKASWGRGVPVFVL